MTELPKIIEDTIDDLVFKFLHDDRKEDEELPRGEIERLVSEGEIMCCQIPARFAEEFHRAIRLQQEKRK